MAEPDVSLELDVAPDAVRGLLKLLPARRGPGVRIGLRWHDTADGTLAGDGLALVEDIRRNAVGWRLERLHAPPGLAPETVARASAEAGLDHALPAELIPVAGFEGRVRVLTHPDVGLCLLEGRVTVLPGTGGVPLVRLTLSGPAAEVGALASSLAEFAAVPTRTMAADALTSSGRVVPASRLGAPVLPPGLSVEDAFCHVVAHLLGVLLHHAPLAWPGGDGEPVHQLRVALRRLRSALGLFARVVACPELDAAAAELRRLGQVLGPPRDWDVFLDGTGHDVAAAFPEAAGVGRLLKAAERRRVGGYAALRRHLDGPEFRRVTLLLASLTATRPWRRADTPIDDAVPEPAETLGDFAARALHRRCRRILAHGRDLAGQSDAALHETRLQAKRLRYAAEFFAPLFPGRNAQRFGRRLADLQEVLGHLNDGVVAASLMAELGAPGRGLAGGLVQGFVAGRSQAARAGIARGWKRFRRCPPFWR